MADLVRRATGATEPLFQGQVNSAFIGTAPDATADGGRETGFSASIVTQIGRRC